MEREFLEDYKVGEKFISQARTVTETDIVSFAALTGDWSPLHTNMEYAKNTIFKERIAHGMLILAIGTALGLQLGQYVMVPKSFIAFYGMDNVRFINPVRIGDTIHCEAEVSEMGKKGKDRGILGYSVHIKNQRGEDVAVLSINFLCGRGKLQ